MGMYFSKSTCKDCQHEFVGYFSSVTMESTNPDKCPDCGGKLDRKPYDPLPGKTFTYMNLTCPEPDKMRLPHYEAAVAYAALIRKRSKKRLRPYLCRCGNYHLTSQKPRYD